MEIVPNNKELKKRGRLLQKIWASDYVEGYEFYRFELSPYNSDLILREYKILEVTKAGYWVDNDKPRWVSGETMTRGTKAFCRYTKRKALVDYKCRTKKRIDILKSQILRSESGLLQTSRWEKELGDE